MILKISCGHELKIKRRYLQEGRDMNKAERSGWMAWSPECSPDCKPSEACRTGTCGCAHCAECAVTMMEERAAALDDYDAAAARHIAGWRKAVR